MYRLGGDDVEEVMLERAETGRCRERRWERCAIMLRRC